MISERVDALITSNLLKHITNVDARGTGAQGAGTHHIKTKSKVCFVSFCEASNANVSNLVRLRMRTTWRGDVRPVPPYRRVGDKVRR